MEHTAAPDRRRRARSGVRSVRGAGALALVVLLAGCGSAAYFGETPTTDPPTTDIPTTGTPTTDIPTTGTPTTGPDRTADPTYSTDPMQRFMTISYTDATVAGVQSVKVTAIYGDGRVIQPGDGLSGMISKQISTETLRHIVTLADEAGLLQPLDFGSPGITDQGWEAAGFHTSRGDVVHHIYAPGEENGLTRKQRDARNRFAAFDRATDAAIAADPAVASPYLPDHFEVRATPVAEVTDESDVSLGDWPFAQDVRTLFGDSGCAAIDSSDAARLVGALGPDGVSETTATGRRLFVATGTEFPAAVGLTVDFPLPGEQSCLTAEPDDKTLTAPWPGEDRRPADAWSRWVAWAAVSELAREERLGPDANSTTDLTWYEANYSVATVDGRTVVDATLHASASRRNDPTKIEVRVDVELRTVVELRTT